MDIKEQYTLDLLEPILQAKVQELQSLISSKKKSLKHAPDGRLRISMHRGKPQWFHVADARLPGGSAEDGGAVPRPGGVFIPASEGNFARSLAQKMYDQGVLAAAEKSLSAVERFMDDYLPVDIAGIYANLHESRQSLVVPVRLLDEEFVRRWKAVAYEGRGFDADTPELFTAGGERVRSKSEVIIADTLARLGIPYRYEYPHKMRVSGGAFSDGAGERPSCCDGGQPAGRDCEPPSGKSSGRMSGRSPSGSSHGRASGASASGRKQTAIVYPDFTCLDVRHRREIIWEHFGLVDSPEYAQNMVAKFEMYVNNGFVPGKNLVMTYESVETPLSSRIVSILARNLGLCG